MNAPQTFKLPKPKACKICRVRFQPSRMIQPCCSYECEVKKAEKHLATLGQRRLKESRRETRQKKLAAKGVKEWLLTVKAKCHKYIKLRDKDDGCISCGTRKPDIQYAAGHYRTVGAAGHLRFNTDNIHKQCNKNCNKERSGNIVPYRMNLVKKIGLERVEAIENDNTTIKWTVDYLKELDAHFTKLIKEIENV